MKSLEGNRKGALRFYKPLVTGVFVFFAVILGIFIVQLSPAEASIPNYINYQARLRDSGGNPITVSTSIQFSIYSHISNGAPSDVASASGPLLWKEVRNQVSGACAQIKPDSDGYFTLNLGSCVSFPSYLDFASGTYYFAVKIGSDAEASPRVILATHPYAFNSHRVDGLHATTSATAGELLALDANKNFNIGSGSLGAAVFSMSSSTATSTVSGNFAVSKLLSVIGNSYFGTIASGTWQGTSIGAAFGGTGTSSLGAAGSLAFSNGTSFAYTAVGAAGEILQANGSGAPTWVATSSLGISGLPAGTSGQTLRYDGSNWVANSIIYNDGVNVGIGTSSPVAELDVYGDMILSGPNRYLTFGNATGSAGYGFRDNNGTLEIRQSDGDWWSVMNNIGEIITVSPRGGDFSNVAEAVTFANTLAYDAVIQVYPGTYIVSSTIEITNPHLKGITGMSVEGTILRPSADMVATPQPVFKINMPSSTNFGLRMFTIDGSQTPGFETTVGCHGIDIADTGTEWLNLEKMWIRNVHRGLSMLTPNRADIFDVKMYNIGGSAVYLDNGAEVSIASSYFEDAGNFYVHAKSTTGASEAYIVNSEFGSYTGSGVGLYTEGDATYAEIRNSNFWGLNKNVVTNNASEVSVSNSFLQSAVTNNIEQYDTSKIVVGASSGDLDAGHILISDPTNFYINGVDTHTMTQVIGSGGNNNQRLFTVYAATGNDPYIQYSSNYYNNSGLVYVNNNLSEMTLLGVQSANDNARLSALTNSSTADALISLFSEAGTPGVSHLIRGWRIIRQGSDANLLFNFDNIDISDGKPAVTSYNVMELDGFNNQMFVNGGAVFNTSSGAYNFQVKGDTDPSLFYVNGGSDKIGIGTTTPGYKLTVAGGVNVTDNYYINGVPLTAVNAGSATGQTLYWDGSAYSPTSSIFVSSNGFVGIGTVTPLNKLSIEGGINLASSTPANTAYALYNYGGQLYWNGNPINTGSGTSSYISDANNDTMVQAENTPNEDKIHFRTNGVERMIIDDSGKVGIGTSTPGAADPSANFVLDIDTNTNTDSGIRVANNSTGNDAVASMRFYNDLGEVGAIAALGSNFSNVPNASNSLALVATGGSGNLLMGSLAGGDIKMFTSSSYFDTGIPALKIAGGNSPNEGYVGINTSTPEYRLDVYGDINTAGTYRMAGVDYGQYFIDSTGTVGRLWQSDGAGRGAWANTSSLGLADIYHTHTSTSISGLDVSNFATNTLSQWYNDVGYITDGNTNWDNTYGFITSSSAENLTNKTGLISMWTNDALYITSSALAGYITSSALSGFTVSNFATNTLSQWYNDAGYITSSALSGYLTYVSTTPRLTGNGTNSSPLDLAQQGAAIGQVLKWNGTYWAPDVDLLGASSTSYTAGDGLNLVSSTKFEVRIDSTLTTSSGILSLANTGVITGAYGSASAVPVFTVDSHGRITSATSTNIAITSSSVSGLVVSNFATNTVSQWYNNVGYITSSALSGFITDGNTNWDNTYGFITSSSAENLTNKTGLISMWTNDALYITSSALAGYITSSALSGFTVFNFATNTVSQWYNDAGYITSSALAGFITDGNTNWDNTYGFITSSSAENLTNKTGLISMWTNDALYITSSALAGYITSSALSGFTVANFATNTVSQWYNDVGYVTSGQQFAGLSFTNATGTSLYLSNNLNVNGNSYFNTISSGTWNGNVIGTAFGGTGTSTLGSAGSVAYSNGTSLAYSATGTAGYLLQANGSGAPSWVATNTLGLFITETDPVWTAASTSYAKLSATNTFTNTNNFHNVNVASGYAYQYNGLNFASAITDKWDYFAAGGGNLTMSGAANTGMGFNTLYLLGSGNFNTGVGYKSLSSVTGGDNNTAIGASAFRSLTTGYDNTAVGLQAGFGDGYVINEQSNIDIGTTFIGTQATRGSSVPTSTILTNATAIGYNSKVGASNSLILGGTGAYAVKVGIGTTTPAYKLDVYGDINTTGTYRIAGVDYGQYFIDSSGTIGQLWQSDGSGRGIWMNTSSLGLAGINHTHTSSSISGLAVSNFATNTVSQWFNDAGYITDGNTNWDNIYGFITSSSAENLTNKTGLISMWTNDLNYITSSALSGLNASSTYWDQAYSWGNHALAGYITSSALSGLTVSNFATNTISQWYNDAGYITSSLPSGSAGQLLVNGGGTTWDPTSQLFLVTSTGYFGVGIDSPLAPIHVAFTSVATSSQAVFIDIAGLSGAGFTGRRSRGTIASPTAVLSGDSLTFLSGRGYDGSVYSLGQGAYAVNAAENWTTSAHGTDLILQTTQNGTTSRLERARITNAGYLGIGTTTPDYPLTVNGDVNIAAGSKYRIGGQQIKLNDLSDVQTSPLPLSNQVLSYNGVDWVNITLGNVSAGSGRIFYLDSTPDSIPSYETLLSHPTGGTEQIESTVVNNSTAIINEYITPTSTAVGGVNGEIDAGLWRFNSYYSVSTAAGVSNVIINVYKRTTSSVETLLFSVTSPEINYTTTTLGVIETIQPAYTVNPDDRLVIKYYATTDNTASTTISLVYNGTLHYTRVETPLTTRHNQLAGLDGGQSDQYYHLTANEYIGTGTGVFVRQDSPTFLGNAAFNVISTGTWQGNVIGSQYGGTGTTTLGTAGGVAFSDGTSYAFTSLGTPGDLLMSNGAAAPTWVASTTFASSTHTHATLSQGAGIDAFSFDGSTAATVGLATTSVTAGSYGSASAVPAFTVDSYGRITSATSTDIAVTSSSISGLVVSNFATNTVSQWYNDAGYVTSGQQFANLSFTNATGTSLYLSNNLNVNGNSYFNTIASGTWNGSVIGTAYGGTGTSTLGAAGSVAYSNGTSLAYSSVGTAGSLLLSNGANAPSWVASTTFALANHTQATSTITGIFGIASGGTGTSTAPALGQLLMGNASGGYRLVATSSLGYGTLALQNANAVNITGGTINGATIGASTPSTAVFTNASSTNFFATTGTFTNLSVTNPSSFGNITWANATGTNAYLSGVLRVVGNSYFGTIASGTWNGSVIGTAYGGTGTSTLGAAGSVAYSNGTSLAYSSVGTAGSLLLSNGAGAPSWVASTTFALANHTHTSTTVSGLVVANFASSNISQWTNDVGYITSSHTHATLSQGPGIAAFSYNGSSAASVALATTSVTAGTYGTASSVPQFAVDAYGRLTTASNVAISIPSTSVTGLGTMAGQNANAVVITGGSITGITDLAVADGGTGASTLAAGGILYGNGVTAVGSSVGTLGYLMLSGGAGAPTWANSTTFALANHNQATSTITGLTNSVTFVAGSIWNGNVIGTAYGGTGTSTLGSAGSVAYSNGTGYAFSAVGSAGQLLQSNAAGAPSWVSTTSLGFASSTHIHALLTRGNGLTGSNYDGFSPTTWAVSYGTSTNTAVQGNQTATISAGVGLSGGVSGDTLGDGFSTSLAVSFAGSGVANTVARSDHNHYGVYASSTHVHAASDITSGLLAIARGGTNWNSTGVTGFVKLTAGVWGTSTINLNSDVSGILPVANGGTGTSTAPALGQLLMGNASGGYRLVATSSLGLSDILHTHPASQITSGTFASGNFTFPNDLTVSGNSTTTGNLYVGNNFTVNNQLSAGYFTAISTTAFSYLGGGVRLGPSSTISGITGMERWIMADENGAFSDVAFKVAGGGFPSFNLGSSSGTINTPLISNANNALGDFNFFGYDGTAWQKASRILAQVDGTPAANSMPGKLIFQTTPTGSATPVTRMVIDSQGRVGIGTTTPIDKLHIESDAAWSARMVVNSNAAADRAGFNFVHLGAGGTNSPADAKLGALTFRGQSSSTEYVGAMIDSHSVGTSAQSYLSFYTNDGSTYSERLRINGSGSVGMGITSTIGNNRLQINTGSSIPTISVASSAFEIDTESGDVGDLNIRLSATGTGSYPAIYLTRSRGTLAVPTISLNNDIIGETIFQGYFGTDFQKAATIRATVDGNPTTWAVPGRLSFFTAPDIATGTAPLERMTIKNNGYIGIGTTTPLNKLHIDDGSIRVSSGTEAWVFGPGAFPNRSVSTDLIGLNFSNSSTWKSGLFTEVGGQVLSYGINVSQIGTRVTSSVGAIFRLDTRANTPYWSIKRQDVGTTTEFADMQISTVGDIGFGGHANDTNSFLAQVHILSRSSSTVGLAVQGALGQTAPIQRWLTSTGTVLGEAKYLSDRFGMTMETGAFIDKNSYIGEEFTRYRANLNSNTLIAWGDTQQFAISENGNCNWDTMQNGISGVGMQAINANGNDACLSYHGFNAAGTANLIFDRDNLPVMEAKVYPTFVSAAERLWVGFSTRATAVVGTADPADGIYFTNNGTTWRGVTRSGGTSTNVECAGQTISTANFAVLKIEIVSSTAVRFYVDNNASDGVNWFYCGESNSNIYASGMTSMLMNGVSSNNRQVLNIDYYRVWQDDSDAPADTVLVLEEAPTSTVELTLDERVASLEGTSAAQSNDIIDIQTLLDEQGITLDETAVAVASLTESVNTLNLSLSETQAMLAALNNRVASLEGAASSTAGSLIDLNSALTDVNARLAALASSTAGMELGNGIYGDLSANALIVNSLAMFNGPVSVKKHATFGEDTVGQAKILIGHNSTTVSFAEPYDILPIISITPIDYDGKWKLTEVATSGFKISISDPQISDMVFNWQVFGASIDSKVFVSDGTTSTIGLVVVYVPPTPPTEEPPVVAPPTEEPPVVEPPVTEPPADEPVVTEPPAEETPSIPTDNPTEPPADEPAPDTDTPPAETAPSAPSPDGSDGAAPSGDAVAGDSGAPAADGSPV